MKMYYPTLVADARADLGEGPAWDARTQRLYWVDINHPSVHVYDPAAGSDRVIDLSRHCATIGTLAPTDDPNRLIIAPDLSIALLDLTTEAVEVLATVPGSRERFNDGKCGPDGTFIVGTMHESDPLGKLYAYRSGGAPQVVTEAVKTSNGLGWSPDYKTMYYIDSKYKEMFAFDYGSGLPAGRRTAFPLPAGDYSPDGLTTDKEGMIWLAWWDGACVTRWNPTTGELIARVDVPAQRVTACCFGGPQMKTLYITCARTGLDDGTLAQFPHSGGLFAVETDVEGQPSWPFRLGS